MTIHGDEPFPKREEDFAGDDRVSWDTVDSRYLLVAADGTEYEWNASYSGWAELVDEELLEAHQAGYKAPEQPDLSKTTQGGTKRKADGESGPAKKAKKEKPNTSIFVSGIPLDATPDEVYEVFKRFGQISKNVDDETPRVKMYTDENGDFKGEALIAYFHYMSVEQAINLADETDFRSSTANGNMRVEKADMSYKKVKDHDTAATGAAAAPKGRRSNKDREKIKRITQDMNDRLADWDDDDPQQETAKAKLSKKAQKNDSDWLDKLVVLKNVFTLDQLAEEPNLDIELEEDFRERGQAEDWGDMLDFTLFDLEPEGVVRLRFRDAEGAEKAARRLTGQGFDGRRLVAYVPIEREFYKKSRRDPREEERRLERYGEQLNAAGDNDDEE